MIAGIQFTNFTRNSLNPKNAISKFTHFCEPPSAAKQSHPASVIPVKMDLNHQQV
jgi:hypothetical protein